MTQIKNSIQGEAPCLTEANLHKYQNRAVRHIMNKSNVALWLDMGL